MTGNQNSAWELNHRGRIHRASSFQQLLKWVKEYRVSSGDTYREAGSQEWLKVMSCREFASILNPDNQWTVSMASGTFRAPDFETVVLWAREGRVTEDAVVEGPRTPPGGVKALALPAMADKLLPVPSPDENAPWLKIDGRSFRAPDVDTVRNWIRESRVPLEALFSPDGENWEQVVTCGLFDLEDWPEAAHGTVEEDPAPEISREPLPLSSETGAEGETREAILHAEDSGENDSIPSVPEPEPEEQEPGLIPYTVITAESEVTVESVKELKRLLRRRAVFTYDEITHPTITASTLSVGEFLDDHRRARIRKNSWIWIGSAVVVAGVAVLEYTGVMDLVTWL